MGVALDGSSRSAIALSARIFVSLMPAAAPILYSCAAANRRTFGVLWLSDAMKYSGRNSDRARGSRWNQVINSEEQKPLHSVALDDLLLLPIISIEAQNPKDASATIESAASLCESLSVQ